jgi:microcystin-dependent protein
MPYRRVSGIRTWFGMIREIAVSSVDLLNECKAIAANRLYGNPTGSSAPPVEISLGSGLAFSGGSLTATASAPTGGVILWPIGSTPSGWLRCDGAIHNIADYPALGSLLGSTYGGNGTTTFGVPDYRGRVPVGAGQGTGLTDRTLGSTFGAETYLLGLGDIPDHSHQFMIPNHTHTFTSDPHTHTDNGHGHDVIDPGHDHGYTGAGASGNYPDTGNLVGPNYTSNTTTSELTGITIATGNASLESTVVTGSTDEDGGGDDLTGGIYNWPVPDQTAMPLTQPSLATHFIIKT